MKGRFNKANVITEIEKRIEQANACAIALGVSHRHNYGLRSDGTPLLGDLTPGFDPEVGCLQIVGKGETVAQAYGAYSALHDLLDSLEGR